MTITPNDDELVEVANAICGCATKAQHRRDVDMLKALRHAAMIEGARLALGAAAKWAKDDAQLCDCHAHSEDECCCGAWCEWKTVPMHRVVESIRALSPETIIKEATDV